MRLRHIEVIQAILQTGHLGTAAEWLQLSVGEVDATLKDAELQYIANTPIEISDTETAQKLLKVLDALDDLDDVVNVHTNADITAEL